LKHFHQGTNSILLFVAPTLRFQTLWPELLRRCWEATITIEPVSQVGDELRVGQINDQQFLALTSWRSLLSSIRRALETAGQTDVIADVIQLQGLCDRMDTEAFLPPRSEELTSSIGTRVYQFCQLVDDVTGQLKSKGQVSTKGLATTASNSSYGRYMKVGDFDCLLKFDAKLWGSQRETPLWFRVYFTALAHERLSKLERKDPPQLLRLGNELFIPLQLPIGVERNEVVDSLVTQIEEIAAYLNVSELDSLNGAAG
jgi:hypothetical protein